MNILDVAAKAGVSKATVSKYLNGTGYVSDAAATRIRAAIDESGYRPNPLARALSCGESLKLVGLICYDIADLYYAQCAAAIESRLRAAGFEMILACTGRSTDTFDAAVESLLRKNVDALLFIGAVFAGQAERILAAAETQKFGHVTYFWNGNRSGYFDSTLEKYIEVESDRVEFSQRPWMKCAEVTDAVINALDANRYDFVRINYANGDMVGHTGNLDATVIAVEAVNLALGRLLEKIRALRGIAIITADHGNADEMYQYNKKKADFVRDADGAPVPLTSHTLNRVPCWIYDPCRSREITLDESIDTRRLSNVAATVFNLMGYEAPEGYDPSLIK